MYVLRFYFLNYLCLWSVSYKVSCTSAHNDKGWLCYVYAPNESLLMFYEFGVWSIHAIMPYFHMPHLGCPNYGKNKLWMNIVSFIPDTHDLQDNVSSMPYVYGQELDPYSYFIQFMSLLYSYNDSPCMKW